jgi:hypothetical protein
MQRRVARHFFTMLAAISLVMCVATSVVIVAVHRPSNKTVVGQRPVTLWTHGLSGRELFVLGQEHHLSIMVVPTGFFRGSAPQMLSRRFDGVAFRDTYVDGRTGWHMLLPYVLILVATGTLPVFAFGSLVDRQFKSSRLRHASRCKNCGYDLRAHDAGDRCPECGTVST